MATSTTQEFSIEAFSSLFEKSRIKKYMSQMEIEQIAKGIENKDVTLLKPLYVILQQANVTDSDIVKDFVMEKNKIVNDFTAEAHVIDRYYAAEPSRKMVAATEEREKAAAENILKNI
jgi:hypothetical protein